MIMKSLRMVRALLSIGFQQPQKKKKMDEFGSYASYKIDQNSSRYILRQNVKLKELPYRLMERPSDGAYWTLSVYRINDKNLKKKRR